MQTLARRDHIARALLFVLALGWGSPLTAQALPEVAPSSVGMSEERLARLETALDGFVADGLLPGGVLLVARSGGVAYHRAFGLRDREVGDAMERDDLFRIASQTKALVSVAVMILQEEGRLLLSDPVSRYLPEWDRATVAVAKEAGGYDVVPVARPVTIRHLLTHTAGIGYGQGTARDRWEAAGIQGWYFAHRDEPIRETVRRMAALPLAAHPGGRWIYGYATDILGAVVEEVSGQTLDDFLRTRLLEPLGMRDTRFYVSGADAERLATVYGRRGGRLERAPAGPGMQTQGEYVDGPRTSFSGGAGLVSTAADYARFLQMLLDGGAFGSTRILAPSSVELMTTDHVGDLYGAAGQGFGLGFSVLEDPGARGTHGSAGEFGWGGAYHSTYWVDPAEELVVVYLTQVIPATGLDDFGKVRALVYQAITDAPPVRSGPGGRAARGGR